MARSPTSRSRPTGGGCRRSWTRSSGSWRTRPRPAEAHVYCRRREASPKPLDPPRAVETLKVELGTRSYPILIGAGLLGSPEAIRPLVPGRDLLIVSNTTVAPLYLARLVENFPTQRRIEVILADGEVHKTLANASRVLDVLVSNRFGRDCTVVALGGGVVGDLAGFAAACYQRGVALVQIPTTLLAQVDSAVGGKTAVNHPGGKNLIGAFHQPVAVISDTATLATLPPRELRAGLAEVIKYGLMCDMQLFEWLEKHLDELLACKAEA